jgi:hypothetical protein
MKAISALPLTYFDSNCKVAVDVHVNLSTTLPSNGKRLFSLGLQIATIKTIDAIMLHCPNGPTYNI